MTSGPVVVLTGAGISRESGLDTFRDRGGIWDRVSLDDVATPEGFARDPDRVNDFYDDLRRRLADPDVRPNDAHAALARLEAEWPDGVTVVTQNVDDLHERAGSRAVIHMHGELARVRCVACGDSREHAGDVPKGGACFCERSGVLRPDIVWFGEMPFHMDEIAALLDRCATFLAVGTSGSVYPAAGFVSEVRRRGGVRTVEFNVEPSETAHLFDEQRTGPAGTTVPAFVDEFLARA